MPRVPVLISADQLQHMQGCTGRACTAWHSAEQQRCTAGSPAAGPPLAAATQAESSSQVSLLDGLVLRVSAALWAEPPCVCLLAWHRVHACACVPTSVRPGQPSRALNLPTPAHAAHAHVAHPRALTGALPLPPPQARTQEFVSGDGFGLPSPVPDMTVRGRTLPGAAVKWKDILFTTGARPGNYLTGWSCGCARDCVAACVCVPIASAGAHFAAAASVNGVWLTANMAKNHLHTLQRLLLEVLGFNNRVLGAACSHHHGLLRLRLPRAPHLKGHVPPREHVRQ